MIIVTPFIYDLITTADSNCTSRKTGNSNKLQIGNGNKLLLT